MGHFLGGACPAPTGRHYESSRRGGLARPLLVIKFEIMSTINTKEPKLIIGLTGGFGTGETTAAGFFKALGAKVIDADKIAHDLIGPARALSSRAKRGIYRESVYKRIISVFGETILDKNSAIDRGKLSEIVFSKTT